MENGPEIHSEISNSEWGKIGYREMLAFTGRFPTSHRGNLIEIFDSLRPGVVSEDWVARKIVLSDKEAEHLGQRLKKEPVLSRVILDKKSFSELARTETQRFSLAKLLAEEDIPEAEAIETIELRLFTDGQELTIGWEKDTLGQERNGWVLRTENLDQKKGEKILGNLEKYRGLIPETKFVYKDGKVLVLTEYVHGKFADENDLVTFRQKLAEKNLTEKNFDLNKQNLIRLPDRVVYVDRDYLDLAR